MDLSQFESLFNFFGISMGDTVAFGGTVSLLISFLKTFIPQLQGRITQALAGVLAIALSIKAYWQAPSGPDVIAIIASSFFVWAIAIGAFGLVKKAGGFNSSPSGDNK